MNPHDFLDVADDLLSGEREAWWRSAVSRAYYAAFHVACQLLRGCGFTVPQTEKAHAYAWRRLANCGHAEIQAAGTELNDLRGMRNWADYELDRPLTHPNAANQVLSASAVIRLLESLPTAPHVLAQITDAIRVYERDVLREVTWRP